jgi:hypothetical protein
MKTSSKRFVDNHLSRRLKTSLGFAGDTAAQQKSPAGFPSPLHLLDMQPEFLKGAILSWAGAACRSA